MAFVRLADFSGSIEAVAFPRIFTEMHALLEPESCIAVKARISYRNGEPSLIVEKVKAIAEESISPVAVDKTTQ